MNINSEEMPTAVMRDSMQPHYTLKILCGPMFGCELYLPAEDYFLIINPALAPGDKKALLASSQQHAVHYTQNTLYIPGDAQSPNITLCLSGAFDNDGLSGFHAEINDIKGSYDSTIYENRVFSLGSVRFAIKRSEDEWSDEVKYFNQAATPGDKHSDKKPAGYPEKRRVRTIFLAVFLSVTLLVLASLILFNKTESERRMHTLSEVFAGAPSDVNIVNSRDNKSIYVLAQNIQEMEWAKEAIFKLRENANVIPLWLTEQKRSVVTHLQRSGYPVMQIDYASPQHPLLAIYRQLTAAEEANLKTAALQAIPFALSVSMKIRTQEQLLQDARQGLDRLQIPYRQITTSSGYGIIVRDALSDNALSSLKHFIADFTHQWGRMIINFSISLDENWLQGKSYVNSSDGYLFMSPRHWYFPRKEDVF